MMEFFTGLGMPGWYLLGFVVLFLLYGTREAKQSVVQLIKTILKWPTMLVMPVFLALGKVRPLQKAANLIFDRLPAGALILFFERKFANAVDPDPVRQALLRGDREPLAERLFPKKYYPYMWRTDIPEDIERPLVEDGRFPNGELPANYLAYNALSGHLVAQTFRVAVISGLVWMVLVWMAYNPANITRWMIAGVEQYQADLSGQLVAENAGSYVVENIEGDYWGSDQWSAALDKARAEHDKSQGGSRWFVPTSDRVIAVNDVLSSGSAGWLTGFFFGLCVFAGYWRRQLQTAIAAKIEGIEEMTKDSITRFGYRAEQRAVAERAYIQQIETATGFDAGTPLIDLGTASGTMRFRGGLGTPIEGQPVRYSLNDMAQHTLILGGTGEGKTRNIILPVVEQILTLRQKAVDVGDDYAISIYGTDGKGVLWQDIAKAAERHGQGDAVRVIGCREGEFGVDLLDGVSPQLIADIINSVARQVSGGSGDEGFWPDMAAEIIRNCAVIAQAWDATPDGYAYAQETGERPYSLVSIYLLVMNTKLLTRAVEQIRNVSIDGVESGSDDVLAVKRFLGAELAYALNYMSTQWQEMAPATKTGIIANVTKIMSPFATNTVLRRQFASGQPSRLLSLREVWGSIALINVSSLEYGVAGKIVNVALKTLLYTEARKRELADPSIGRREKLLFVADEFQDLITADQGLSDATFWNVARSTGTIGFIATQGMSALEQAIGKVASENFALQMRSKIILRVEDNATISYVSQLAGKTLRGFVGVNGKFESWAALEMAMGYDPVNPTPVGYDDSRKAMISCVAESWSFFAGAAATLLQQNYVREPFELDLRAKGYSDMYAKGITTNRAAEAARSTTPMISVEGGGRGEARQDRQEYQQLLWRAEDKNQTFFEQGFQMDDLVKPEDIVNMGRAHALMIIQRSGAARMDLVRVG
ncbi:type IV secretory system conjugative DNA transfer family protein [Aeromonas hydrophila]|uniref:type IV secretory system conjugative DNA transfer family protein n=1 Tax=Aeromonas hydrophila TaxID=644 RepID=UPI001C5AC822|nr:TraM recognition domain-containing protein [Aeromonas hydrophila]MBW3847028.1 TraM recognition domain-containing protein [Aeromonas hydrophila]